MTVALYATIWLSLLCFVAGETGKRQARLTGAPARWARAAWATGVGLAIAHSLLALHAVYGWDHARAVTAAAERAATVYGVAWRGSLFVNYAFIAWWMAEAVWWWRAPDAYLRRASIIEWAWRIVALVMWANGAVIFASTGGRLIGAPLILLLVLVWSKFNGFNGFDRFDGFDVFDRFK